MSDTVKDERELFDKMEDGKSDQIDIVVTRDPQPGKTFSKEALESLHHSMSTFVTARLVHRMRQTGADLPGVSNLKVTLSVEMDGRTVTVGPDERPWYIIDGAARAGATK